MQALIIAAHGSQNETANRHVRELRDRVADLAPASYELVRCAFLASGKPGLDESIDDCAHARATRIAVLPYFLNAGFHVSQNLPALIEQARHRHPGIQFQLLPHFGSAPQIPRLIAQTLSNF